MQRAVEEPQLHIVARCGSGDIEQLAYSETRLQCILDLKDPVNTGDSITVNDILRFYNGDKPARSFENGNQRGGHYFCNSCGIYSSRIYELDHAYNCSIVTFKDSQQKMLQGVMWCHNTILQKPKPLCGIVTKDLKQS